MAEENKEETKKGGVFGFGGNKEEKTPDAAPTDDAPAGEEKAEAKEAAPVKKPDTVNRKVQDKKTPSDFEAAKPKKGLSGFLKENRSLWVNFRLQCNPRKWHANPVEGVQLDRLADMARKEGKLFSKDAGKKNVMRTMGAEIVELLKAEKVAADEAAKKAAAKKAAESKAEAG